MPDDDFSDDTDTGGDGGSNAVQQLRAHNKKLEAEAKAGREAMEKAAGLERRLAFAEAGLGESPMREYFVKGYDGDTSPEAIRAAATAAGLPLLGATATPQPDRSADVAAHAAMNQAAAGGTTEGDRNAAYHAGLTKAQSPEEVLQHIRQFDVPVTEDYQ